MNHKFLWMFLFSSFVSVSSSPDSLQDPQYVLKGQEINFLPSLPGKPDRVGWIHEGRDVVWFDPQTGKEDVSSSYKDRITLEQDSPRLTIKDATYKDSGNYDLKLMINDQHHHLKYRIEVIEKVDQPHISCVLTSPNRVLLVCSTDSKHPDLLEFKWSSDGKEHSGPNLQINVRGKHDDRVYRCDVSNPLTKETANFTAGDCFLEPFEKTKKRIRRSPCNTPDVSQDLKYVLKGQEINFKPPIPEKPDLIIWFYHDGRGVVLFDDKGELNFPSYKDRIILDHRTAELTINNATYEDSGSYILRWNINNEECRLKYRVEVIDNIPKVEIPNSTDWIYYVTIGAVGCLVTILGYIVRSEFPCSERLKNIRAKCFERQETTEAANPRLLKEKRSFNSEPNQPPISQEKQNLGSGEDAREEDLSQTQELDS
ncbi:uncharacterized protein [Syngnathus scovelli]|uniref:uncharacterized protein n=1 Tax=Syngnathus scovelli TaxID=161590 RepID=UPI0035CC44D0